MPIFHVDSEAVVSASTAAQATIGRIQSEVANLHGQLTNLQNSWTGTAATAFQGVVTQWHQSAARLDEGLTSISHALTLAATQYSETELSTARMFQV